MKLTVYGSYIHQFILKIYIIVTTRREILKFDKLDDENYAEEIKYLQKRLWNEMIYKERKVKKW